MLFIFFGFEPILKYHILDLPFDFENLKIVILDSDCMMRRIHEINRKKYNCKFGFSIGNIQFLIFFDEQKLISKLTRRKILKKTEKYSRVHYVCKKIGVMIFRIDQ